MEEVFVSLIIMLLAAFSIWRPWVAVVILLMLQLFGQIVPGLEDIRGLSIIAIAGLLGTTRYFLRGELKGWPVIWPLAFCAMFVINFLVSGRMDWGFVYLIAGAIGTYYLTIYAIRSPRQILVIAITAILVAVMCAIVSIADFNRGGMEFSGPEQFYASQIHGMKRSLLGDANYFFPVIMPGLFFGILLCYKRTTPLVRTILFAGIAVMTMGVIATLSRGSVITLATIFIILVSLQKRRFHFRGLLLIVALCGMILGLYYVFPDTFLLLMERFKQREVFDLTGSRSHLMWVGIQEFLSSPIWGSGLGTIYASVGHTPHDGYTALLGETGLIGFLLFYSMPFTMVTFLRKVRRRCKNISNMQNSLSVLNVFYAFMLGMLVYNFFEPMIYSKTTLLLIAVTQLFISGLQGKKTEPIHALFTVFQTRGSEGSYPRVSKGAKFAPQCYDLVSSQFLDHRRIRDLKET
jgi:hypothetical protein